MKRIISALLILIMMIPPMVLPAHAATLVQADAVVRLTTDVGENGAAVGDTVTVTVEYENIPASSAVDFCLVYDPTYLEQPADADITYNLSGQKAKNSAYIVEERISQELAGQQAVKVVAANDGNCLKGTDGKGTLFTVKFVVAQEAPAPGIPLEFVGTFNNLYSNKDMKNTIQVVNTHIATANPTKEVTAVSLNQAPTKTDYVQGQALDMEGGSLLVTYNDGSQEEVRLSMAQVTQYDFTKIGTQTVKATYAEKTVSFEINTTASELLSISIGQAPDTVEYIKGKTVTLDRSGGVLLLHYTGNLVKTLDMNDSLVTVSDYDKNLPGVQAIKVYYGGFETEFKIAVVKNNLQSIDVRTPMICGACGEERDSFVLITVAGGDPSSMNFNARLEYIEDTANNVTCGLDGCEGATFSTKMKMVYFLEEPFDVENATLYVTYVDGSSEEMPMTEDMVEFKNTIATTQNVEVAYGEQWMLVKNVRTKKKEATAITALQEPNDTEYVVGQSFDPTGGTITVAFNNGTEEEFDMTDAAVTFFYNALDTPGQHKITVFYENQKATFWVSVVARAVEKISVDEEAKSTYIQGQEPDPNTKLYVKYNDGKTETAEFQFATVTGYDPDQVGTQLVTVTYGNRECSWLVTVEEKVVTKLELVGTPPATILEGVDLTLEDCTLTATYNEGKLVEENIAITPEMIRFNKEVGTQTVTVEFEEGEVSFEITVLEKSLTSIEVEGVQEQYLIYDSLDRSIGQLKLIYDNGFIDYIDFSDEDISVEGFQSDAVGEYAVTVSYQGFTATYQVEVYADVSSILVDAPAKTEYKEGEPLDLTGGMVHITHSNGTKDVPLTLGMISGYDPNAIGEQTLTVKVGDATAKFTVTVIARQLTGITVSPETIEHKEWEELNLSHVVITAWYDNNTSEPVTEKASKAEYDTYVLYTYEGKTARLNINVIKKAPTFIEWAEEPQKRAYFVGDPLLKDGTIRVHYNDQTNEQIPVTDENVSVIGDTDVAGTHTVYVKYKDLSPISFEITVDPVMVEKIEITDKPNCSYIEGQPLNVAGGMILVTYNNKDTEPLAMDAAGVSLSGYNPEQIGEQTVTVTYGGQTDTFTVNVRAKKAESIKVTIRPKTDYLEGVDTALNLAGGKLTVTYDNGTKQVVDLSAAKVSGFHKDRFGTQEITVEYLGLKATYEITMNEKAVDAIAIAKLPNKTLYRQGVEKFDPAGGQITVFYNNDTKETVNLSKANISGFSNLFAGNVTLTAAYEGYAVEFKVLILAENPFKDVKVNEYYETPVLWAVTKEITKGTAEDTFSPNDECTRGQIVTFLWRAAGEPAPKSTKNPFKDVKRDQYYYDAVLWAVENGITNGIDATHFAPDAACTRGQVATFLWRAKSKPAAANSKHPFTDLQKNEYYYNAVLWAVENGITNGMTDTTFAPNTTCTRGHIVTFLYRTYK